MLQFFESDGLRLAYIDVVPHGRDRGEPILLIHGFASNHRVNWVNPRWVETLTHDGRRVIAFDNRGHGQSDKPSDPADYHSALMAGDARRLLDHLGIARADVMGYSMGARISAYLALAAPDRVRRLILGGLGDRLVEGVGLPLGIADAMEAPSLETLTDPMQRMFRAFAEQTKSDRVALAACIRGSRQTLSKAEAARLSCPTLVAVGTRDAVAGEPHRLAAMLPQASVLEIPGRDHNHRGRRQGLQGGRVGVPRPRRRRRRLIGAPSWKVRTHRQSDASCAGWGSTAHRYICRRAALRSVSSLAYAGSRNRCSATSRGDAATGNSDGRSGSPDIPGAHSARPAAGLGSTDRPDSAGSDGSPEEWSPAADTSRQERMTDGTE